MALTKVAPALFGTGNNITSVTVGGSANTISLTFDGSGVITSATNNAISVANTAITGNIISSQITSVANTQITGNITAAQITSVANTQLTGLIQAAQIGSANATLVTSGTLPTARLPAGSVVQIVTANTTGASGTTTTSTSYTNSGLVNLIITPKLAASKFRISFYGFVMHINPQSDNFGGSVMIYNSVNGGANTALSSSSYSVEGMYVNDQYGASWFDKIGNITMVDTPSYTLGQSILYQLWFKKSTRGSGGWYVHHTGGLVTYAGNTLISAEVTEYAT